MLGSAGSEMLAAHVLAATACWHLLSIIAGKSCAAKSPVRFGRGDMLFDRNETVRAY
jgi:hypothetical protein